MQKSKVWKLLASAAVAGMLAVSLAGCGGAPSSSKSSSGTVSLLETGSSLLYPLFTNYWVQAYQKDHPNVQITTQSTGSGTGISDSIKGLAQIGASDAYLSDSMMKQNPDMLNIPLAISAQQINYNVPGLNNTHLKLSGPVLAQMYTKPMYWDDPAIKSLNPGVSLPHNKIVPIHRSDGSGDTFLFTSFLTDTASSTWTPGAGLQFPGSLSVPLAIGAKGNNGMVEACEQNKYSVAYVGISWLDQATKGGLGYAELKNASGDFVLPDATTIKAAAAAMFQKTPPDERVSLISAPGAQSYPIINYEYGIVKQKQADAKTAAAVKAFLDWCLSPTGGETATYLDPVHFQPLPASVAKMSQGQVDKIGS